MLSSAQGISETQRVVSHAEDHAFTNKMGDYLLWKRWEFGSQILWLAIMLSCWYSRFNQHLHLFEGFAQKSRLLVTEGWHSFSDWEKPWKMSTSSEKRVANNSYHHIQTPRCLVIQPAICRRFKCSSPHVSNETSGKGTEMERWLVMLKRHTHFEAQCRDLGDIPFNKNVDNSLGCTSNTSISPYLQLQWGNGVFNVFLKKVNKNFFCFSNPLNPWNVSRISAIKNRLARLEHGSPATPSSYFS